MYLKVVRGTYDSDDSIQSFDMEKGESILQVLVRNHLSLEAFCGGKGTCGKCKIQLIEGDLPVSESDERILTKNQIDNGMRLACRAYPDKDLVISVKEENDFEVLTGSRKTEEVSESLVGKEIYGIAIDIGTTTIAMELVEVHSGRIVKSIGELNRQRNYGADVVSRIAASKEGHKDTLTTLIRKQINSLIRKMEVSELSKIVIAANTTMCHILLGYSCNSLGSYPYQPVNLKTVYEDSKKLFGEDVPACEVIILPGISTYVGADIVSGIVECGLTQTEDIAALVDLGTNGEMAVGNRNGILVTSAAAGPAFEGGNISCGTGSIPGAVSSVEIQYRMAKVKTIQDRDPVGICGSGVLELTAELLKARLIDETGAMSEEYMEEGYPVSLSRYGEVVFSQKDVREVQMAKSAVYSALVLLVKRFGILLEQVDSIYLAGGFGFHLNVEKAIARGLLPKEWSGKIKLAGNTSLAGARGALLDKDFVRRAEEAVAVSKELSLAMDEEFQDLYTKNMYFG